MITDKAVHYAKAMHNIYLAHIDPLYRDMGDVHIGGCMLYVVDGIERKLSYVVWKERDAIQIDFLFDHFRNIMVEIVDGRVITVRQSCGWNSVEDDLQMLLIGSAEVIPNYLAKG